MRSRRVWCEPTAVDHPSPRATGIALSSTQSPVVVVALCTSTVPFADLHVSQLLSMLQHGPARRHPRDHQPRE